MSKWRQIDQYKKLYKFIGRPSFIYLAFGVLTGGVTFAVEIVFAYLLQAFLITLKIIPNVDTATPSWIPTKHATSFMFLMVLAILVRGLAQWIHSYLIAAAFEIQRDHQRLRIIEWSLSAPTASSSQLMTLYTEGTYASSSALTNLQGITILTSTSILIFLYLSRLSWITTLVGIVSLVLIGLGTRGLDKKISIAGYKASKDLEHINARLLNNIKNLLLVQIYGTQGKESLIIKSKLRSVLKNVLGYQKVMYLKSVTPQTLGMIALCILSAVSIRLSWIAPSAAIIFFYLFVKLVQNFAEATKFSSSILFSLTPTINLAQWWAENAHDGIKNPVMRDSPVNIISPLSRPIGWILKNVSFKYPGSDSETISNLSFKIPAGSCVVITGESGKGKSTLIGLLIGNLKPSKGEILIDSDQEMTLSEIRPKLLQSIGYVGPESFLIEGTILENICYGLNCLPSETDIKSCLEKAECKFIQELPLGLQHKITDQGQGLSAGQKQRISLVRALLRKPKILILDEATSNLDQKTEARLVSTLSKLKGHATIVAVTHRDGLLSLADHQIVL